MRLNGAGKCSGPSGGLFRHETSWFLPAAGRSRGPCARGYRVKKELNSNPMAKTPCPFCGYEFDASTCINNPKARPSSGDPTVCIGCGNVLVFDEDYRPRKATEVETIELQRDVVWPMIQRASQAIRELRTEDKTLAQGGRRADAAGKT